jgi:hypothetical protein
MNSSLSILVLSNGPEVGNSSEATMNQEGMMTLFIYTEGF